MLPTHTATPHTPTTHTGFEVLRFIVLPAHTHTYTHTQPKHNVYVEKYIFFEAFIEDCILRKFLDSSEELLERGRGGARIYRSFCWKTNKNQTLLWKFKRLRLITKYRYDKLVILMLFSIWKV